MREHLRLIGEQKRDDLQVILHFEDEAIKYFR